MSATMTTSSNKFKWMLVLLMATTVHFKAHADKVDDLSTEAEAEELEVYDQKQIETAQRKETLDNEKKSRSLEQQIKQIRHENQNLGNRIDRQSDRYTKAQRRAQEVEGQHRKLSLQRDQLKNQLDSLRSRTQQAQNRAQSAEELKKSLHQELRQHELEKRDLNAQLRSAERRLEKAQRAIKSARERQKRLSQEKNRLQNKTAATVERARRLEERSLSAGL